MEEAPPPAPLRSLARLRRQLALQLGFFTGCRRTAAFLCIGSGILVLIGWWHHITLFKTLHVGTAPMRPLSAIEIILMGCSLLLLGGHSRRVFWKRAGFWMALTFMVFSLFAFGHTLFSWRTPLDPYLLRSSPDRALTNSYVACTIYLLQGTALLLLWFRRFLAAQSLALVSLTTSYFVIIGYLYNLTELQQLPPFHSLSLPFLILFSISAIGILASRPEQGFLREILSENPGGIMARYLLPPGFLFPLANGLLQTHNLDTGLYGHSVAMGLTTLSVTVLFSLSIWFCAKGLNATYNQLRRRERMHAVLSECNQNIIRTSERQRLFDVVCRSLVETGGFQGAWIAQAFPEGNRYFVPMARGLGGESLADLASIVPAPSAEEQCHPFLRAVEAEGGLVLEDCPDVSPWKGLPRWEQPRSLALFPLRVRNRFDSLLVVHAAREGSLVFDRDNRLLLEEVAGDLSHALSLMEERRIHRQAEDELHRTSALLQEALDKNPTLFYILHVGENRNVYPAYISENVHAILGYSPAEAMSPGWWTSHLHSDDRVRPHSLTFPPSDRNTLTRDFRFQDRDGAYVWIRDEQRVVRNDSGEPVRIVGSWSDITERIHLEEQFRHTQKFESLGRLTGGVAHDLNNILTVIDGHASLLEVTYPEESKESIEEIMLATQRATRLTRQLLTFSKKQFIEPRNLNLNAVIGDMGKMLRRSVGEDIEIVVEPDPSIPPVFADEGMIEQILLNLVVNARDAMPKGGRIRIGTAATRIERQETSGTLDVPTGDYVRFSVSDTGCGIPVEHLARIFDPFFTTKEPGKGTGLGLATVRSIVHQHGGTLTVESEPGQGATFHIYLPVATALSLSTPEKRTGLKTLGKEGGATILLVEDDDAVRSMMKSILEHVGHRILEASTAKEALEAYEQCGGAIDLLLSDVVLPGGFSGRDLAIRLHAIDPGLPVLHVTGYPTPADGEAEGGHDEVLMKPFSSVSLIEKVRERLVGVKVG